jgi:hypothetical protein
MEALLLQGFYSQLVRWRNGMRRLLFLTKVGDLMRAEPQRTLGAGLSVW